MVTNVTLIWWNNVKDRMKIVLRVQFATNQVANGVKSLKETLTHQAEAVWALPKTSFKNKNCLKSPQIFNRMTQIKKGYREIQALRISGVCIVAAQQPDVSLLLQRLPLCCLSHPALDQ